VGQHSINQRMMRNAMVLSCIYFASFLSLGQRFTRAGNAMQM